METILLWLGIWITASAIFLLGWALRGAGIERDEHDSLYSGAPESWRGDGRE